MGIHKPSLERLARPTAKRRPSNADYLLAFCFTGHTYLPQSPCSFKFKRAPLHYIPYSILHAANMLSTITLHCMLEVNRHPRGACLCWKVPCGKMMGWGKHALVWEKKSTICLLEEWKHTHIQTHPFHSLFFFYICSNRKKYLGYFPFVVRLWLRRSPRTDLSGLRGRDVRLMSSPSGFFTPPFLGYLLL